MSASLIGRLVARTAIRPQELVR